MRFAGIIAYRYPTTMMGDPCSSPQSPMSEEDDNSFLERLFRTPPRQDVPEPEPVPPETTTTVTQNALRSTAEDGNAFDMLYTLAQTSMYNPDVHTRQRVNFRLFMTLSVRSSIVDLLPMTEEMKSMAREILHEIETDTRRQHALQTKLQDQKTINFLNLVSSTRVIRDTYHHIHKEYMSIRDQLPIYDEPPEVTELVKMLIDVDRFHLRS